MRHCLVLLLLILSPLRSAEAQETLPSPTGEVLLTVTGKVERTNGPNGAEFDRSMLEALGVVRIQTSTSFTDGRKTFEGVPLGVVLARIGARGTTLKATALNDYSISLPVSDLTHDPILAMRMDGVLLTPRDKGPLWIVFPKDRLGSLMEGAENDSKWVWQLDRLDVE